MMNFPIPYSLVGKRALACGSTQGIGRACAMQLARLGAAVTLVARREEALVQARADLPADEGQNHDVVCADFRDPEDLVEKVRVHLQEAGPVHILLNNTGGPPHGSIVEAPPEAFRQAFTMHLVCNQLLVQTLLPGMKEAGYGRIINIISTSVKEPIKGLGVSNTTRWAVAAWAKTLAGELTSFGITVNNILPGYTATARLDELIDARAEAAGVEAAEIRREMIARIPAGRLASPDDIAAAAGFLASPAAAYISGINLPVDGGKTASL